MKIISTKEQKDLHDKLLWILSHYKTIIYELEHDILPDVEEEWLRMRIKGLIDWAIEAPSGGGPDELEDVIDELYFGGILYKRKS